jgi:hypothetical protein
MHMFCFPNTLTSRTQVMCGDFGRIRPVCSNVIDATNFWTYSLTRSNLQEFFFAYRKFNMKWTGIEPGLYGDRPATIGLFQHGCQEEH